MMYFFTTGSSILFAIVGLLMVVWIIGACAKSTLGCVFGSTDTLEKPISVRNTTSADGKFRVQNAGFDEHLKLFFAGIERTEDGKFMNMVTGQTENELEDWIKDEMERLSQKYYPQ